MGATAFVNLVIRPWALADINNTHVDTLGVCPHNVGIITVLERML